MFCIFQKYLFESLHAGNYHPTYEVFLDKSVNQLQIKIQRKITGKEKITFKTAWNRLIIIRAKRGKNTLCWADVIFNNILCIFYIIFYNIENKLGIISILADFKIIVFKVCPQGNIDHNKLKNWKSDLCKIIEDLTSNQLKKLKHLMRNCAKRDSIPASKLDETNEDKYELVNLIVESWGFEESVKAIKEFMNELPRKDDFVTKLLEPYI